jgi:hypothetical protein
MNPTCRAWLSILSRAVSTIMASVFVHVVCVVFEVGLTASLPDQIAIGIAEGEAYAAQWCAIPIMNQVLDPFIPNIARRRRELGIVAVLVLCCPFVQTAVWCASHVATPMEVWYVHCAFTSSLFGAIFTDNLIGPVFEVPHGAHEEWLIRHVRFCCAEIGGKIARALVISLVFQIPLAQAVARDIGTSERYAWGLVKVAMINDLRRAYEGAFRTLIGR